LSGFLVFSNVLNGQHGLRVDVIPGHRQPHLDERTPNGVKRTEKKVTGTVSLGNHLHVGSKVDITKAF
jgi:hypothetical protein